MRTLTRTDSRTGPTDYSVSYAARRIPPDLIAHANELFTRRLMKLVEEVVTTDMPAVAVARYDRSLDSIQRIYTWARGRLIEKSAIAASDFSSLEAALKHPGSNLGWEHSIPELTKRHGETAANAARTMIAIEYLYPLLGNLNHFEGDQFMTEAMDRYRRGQSIGLVPAEIRPLLSRGDLETVSEMQSLRMDRATARRVLECRIGSGR